MNIDEQMKDGSGHSNRIRNQLSHSLLPLAGAPEAPPAWRLAAVLMVLFPRGNRVSFLLTVRASDIRHHAGQVSLPGGSVDPDEDPWKAALREAQEELGIDPRLIRAMGRLPAVPVSVSRFLIVPFVGWCDKQPELKPNTSEVAEVVHVDVESILDPATVREETWELRGAQWLVGYFALQHLKVWGATAHILADFAESLGVKVTVASRPVAPGTSSAS